MDKYLTTKEVLQKFDMTIDTIRYYERIGLLPKIPRNKNGYRIFDEQTISWIYFVKVMRKAGISVESLIEYVELVKLGDDSIFARKQILLEQKEILEKELNELNDVVNMLSTKIENYESHLIKYEKEKLYKKEKK